MILHNCFVFFLITRSPELSSRPERATIKNKNITIKNLRSFKNHAIIRIFGLAPILSVNKYSKYVRGDANVKT